MSKPTRLEPRLPYLPTHMRCVLELVIQAFWQALLVVQPDGEAGDVVVDARISNSTRRDMREVTIIAFIIPD